jgi:hypothetical protein
VEIGNTSTMLLFFLAVCSSTAFAEGSGVSLETAPYVHPKIIEDLSTWVSDNGEQVVAINLDESENTNRYFGDIQVNGTAQPFVFYENKDDCKESGCLMGAPSFGYRVLGRTPGGVYVLFTEWTGGGSGRFRRILLASIEKDRGLTTFSRGTGVLRLNRERRLIKKLGEIALGDRYEGEIVLRGNTLRIGKDEYSHSAGLFMKTVSLEIEP